jgi:betaine-aldehyde dehydrogenase
VVATVETVPVEQLAYVDRPWRMLVGGELCESSSGQTDPVVFPGDGTVIAQAPLGTAADVDAAVAAALAAAPGWRRTAIVDRAAALLALAEVVDQHGDELAWIDTLDNGSPIKVMRNDYRMAVDQLRYYAGLALQLRGETIPTAAYDALDFTVREPFGVVARIVPFNHPLMFAASRIAPPLLAGNSVVLKPSEATPLSALRLGELARELFPPGVLNVVNGTGAEVGDRLVTHPDVYRVAFTGSVETGRRIQARAATSAVKTVTLELGGKNPMVVFEDADRDAAVAGALRGMNFTWQGQSCGSTSRLLVQRSIFDEFVAQLGRAMSAMTVGDPRLETTDVGALVSEAHHARVSAFVHRGLDDPSLELVAGGELPAGPGFYVPPTLFVARGGTESALFEEEIFGPVLVAAPFDTYDEAVERANSVALGLTASVWTSDLKTAMSAARDIEAGYLWVNWASEHIAGAEFGGVKNSGVGREEGIGELESFTQPKNVYVRF